MLKIRDHVTMQEVKHCIMCDVVLTENNTHKTMMDKKHYRCIDCHNKVNEKSNPLNMYVNGNYISRKHPLHKPGNYKSFGDAAFTALQKGAQVKEGYVYVITNPAWPDWVKIGMAIDAEDRLNGYQTSSPMRDYELVHAIPTPDRARAERVAHKAAAMCGERKGEWFKIDTAEAVTILQHIKEAEDADRQQRESTE